MLPLTLAALLLRYDLDRHGLCGSDAGLAAKCWFAVVERTSSEEVAAASLSSSDMLEPLRIRNLLELGMLDAALFLIRSTERATVDDFIANRPAFKGKRSAHSVVYSSSITTMKVRAKRHLLLFGTWNRQKRFSVLLLSSLNNHLVYTR